MKLTKSMYCNALKNYGIEESVWVDGREYCQIPTKPDALIFWACDKIAKPLFDDDENLIGWKEADSEYAKKIQLLAKETARANGYEIAGIEKVLS